MKNFASIIRLISPWKLALVIGLCASPCFAESKTATPITAAFNEEFVGPFASWANAKRDFGAIGDGKADDTVALQKALDELKVDGKPRVLFLPAGTYRITSQLNMISQINFGVVGEHPDTTIIKWDGPAEGTMLFCNGARYGRYGRITWDGASRAETAIDHDWDGMTPNANSHNEHADEVFKDVGFGIRGGKPHMMDAECAVTRCKFLRCSKAGVSLESFNALDWWIWDSYFENCQVGVTNDPGAGHFHVYNSLFKGSTESDMKMNNTSYFGIRGNTSIGSRAFFTANWIGASAQITLQSNTILDPTGPIAIQVGNFGSTLLLDNTIRTLKKPTPGKSEHLAVVNQGATTLSVGNTFTFSGTEAVHEPEKMLSIEDRIVPAAQIKSASPVLPPTPLNHKRPIIEVAPGADGATVQKAIDDAVKMRGKRAVVHLPMGVYGISKTLVIPANAGIQIIGDGFATRLSWSGDDKTPMLRLMGPSRASLREMEINAGAASIGIAIEKCDQIGARIWMDQGEVSNSQNTGLLGDGLDNADVSLRNFFHSGNKGVAVKIIGGPRAAAGQKVAARTVIFGGASSSNNLSYDVQNNGRLMAQDIWYEGAPPRFLHFTDKSWGTFTLNGATTATGRPGPNMPVEDPNFAALSFDGFRGDVSLLGVNIGTNLSISGKSDLTRLLGLLHGTESYFQNTSTGAQVAMFGSTKYTEGGGATPIPNQGQAEPKFVLQMLAQLRADRPRAPTALPVGITDARLHRVTVSGGQTGIRLSR